MPQDVKWQGLLMHYLPFPGLPQKGTACLALLRCPLPWASCFLARAHLGPLPGVPGWRQHQLLAVALAVRA